jgi:hypothetical protein
MVVRTKPVARAPKTRKIFFRVKSEGGLGALPHKNVVIDGNGLQLINFKPYCEFFKTNQKNFFCLGYDDVPWICFKGTHIVPSGGDPGGI